MICVRGNSSEHDSILSGIHVRESLLDSVEVWPVIWFLRPAIIHELHEVVGLVVSVRNTGSEWRTLVLSHSTDDFWNGN